ncbi:hypothetical protein B0J17DRAFT_765038 [Rhizoctonia solani]|nr:hypothetical protein B0J17DRAFT_765038 [Rhizoctonia solani]
MVGPYDNNTSADPYSDAQYPPPPSDSRNGTGRGRERSRSASPAARPRSPPRRRSPPLRPRGAPSAQPSNVLGVFGLSIRTQERDLDEEFSRFGKVEKVTIVYDQRSDRSRGFGFIKMSTVDEAARCITELNGLDLNGRRIRVDYSTTERPHAPTPGEYMGHRRPEYEDRRRRDDRDSYYGGRDWKDRREHRERDRDREVRDREPRDRDRDREYRDRDYRDREKRSPRRSVSPSHRRKRSYSRSPPRGSSPTRERREEGSRW